MRLALVTPVVLALVSAVVAACSAADEAPPAPTQTSADAAVVDASEEPKADGGASTDAPAPKKETAIASSIGTVERTLVRAQFGHGKADAGKTIYLEAHLGGDPACPDQTSPTPDYTLIVANVPRGAPGEVFSKADGVSVSYFDFKGDQITGGKPFTTATQASVTIVHLDGEASVEIEVEATFAEGKVEGRAYATYCASLSD